MTSNWSSSIESLNNAVDGAGDIISEIIRLHDSDIYSTSRDFKFNPPKTKGADIIAVGKYWLTPIFGSIALWSRCKISDNTGKDKSWT